MNRGLVCRYVGYFDYEDYPFPLLRRAYITSEVKAFNRTWGYRYIKGGNKLSFFQSLNSYDGAEVIDKQEFMSGSVGGNKIKKQEGWIYVLYGKQDNKTFACTGEIDHSVLRIVQDKKDIIEHLLYS